MAKLDHLYIESMMDADRLSDFKAARDLSVAQRNTPALAKELPYVAEGYRSFISALRRQVFVRAHANKVNLVPYRLMGNSRYIGMATIQLLDPIVCMRSGTVIGPEFTNGAELSYWHEPVEDPVLIGCDVVDALLSESWRVGAGVIPWMVTMPGDDIKSEVCVRTGFEPCEPAIPYSIGDGVTDPRQLWVHSSVE